MKDLQVAGEKAGDDEPYSEQETAARRERTLKQLLTGKPESQQAVADKVRRRRQSK
jgi:hypothetical protein